MILVMFPECSNVESTGGIKECSLLYPDKTPVLPSPSGSRKASDVCEHPGDVLECVSILVMSWCVC